jgi:hypothetical protein
MQIDWEQHKNDFMMYVWNNLDALNYAIRKNITYDPEIYDDVTADTLCRIGEYILRNHVFIKDFKGMFFLSCKRQYIAEQNKKRDRDSKSDREYFSKLDEALGRYYDYIEGSDTVEYSNCLKQPDMSKWLDDGSMENEIKAERTHELFKYLEGKLNEVFEPNEVDIFLIYFRLKSERKGISYKKLADIMDKDVKYITRTIVKIKKYIKESSEIQENKRKIMKEEL